MFRSICKMRKLLPWAALLPALASPPASADFALYQGLAFSRFNEVISRGEEEIRKDPSHADATTPPLCFAYYKMRRYDKMNWCVERMDERVAAGRNMHRDGIIMASDMTPFAGMLRAAMLLDFGQFDKAMREGEAALALVDDAKWGGGMMAPLRYRLEFLPTIALAAALAGNRPKAEEKLKQLEEISLGFFGAAMKDHKNAAMARIYMALGNCDKVLEFANQGEQNGFLRGLTDVLMGGGADSMKTQFDLSQALMSAKCLAISGKSKEARAALDYIVKSPRAPEQGEIYWLALYDRGRLATQDGQEHEAAKLFAQAVEVIERQRASINTEAAKIGFVGDKQAVYGRLIALLVELGRSAEAFDYVERSKARALVDLLAGKKDFSAQGADPQKTREVLAQLDAADFASRVQGEPPKPGDTGGSGAVRSLSQARQEMQAIAPELATLVSVSAIPSDELKALIGQDEALVEFYYQDTDMYAFVLNRAGLQVVKLDAQGLDAQVRELRGAVERMFSDSWRAPAQQLYARLWRPLEGALGSAKSVVVVAHGVLHYLPFALLRRPDDLYLVDQYGLRFLPSASVLKFLRPAQGNLAAPMLVLGNPDLGDPKLDLQFAESEAHAVAGLYADARVLVRKDASETNFKKAGSVFSRIHFATHGKFQADDPLASGLYLAKDADNDGLLTAGELYSINLTADLVTLSACETGLGKVANGDDVVGLTRGFLFAGSRSIVASLWSVDDKATAELMITFYRNLSSMDKVQALRQAQISTRRSFANPFFWAAFQLTGRGD